MSKANGLGDLELAGDEPDVEIGNRVWKDLNKNGIQDAHEPSIPGMQIGLFEIGNGSLLLQQPQMRMGYINFQQQLVQTLQVIFIILP